MGSGARAFSGEMGKERLNYVIDSSTKSKKEIEDIISKVLKRYR